MSRLLCSALLFLPGIVGAQIMPTSVFKTTIDAMRKQGQLPPLDQRNPMEPVGFPANADKVSMLPESEDDTGSFKIIHAGPSNRKGSVIHITEGAEFEMRGYHIVADKVEGDLKSKIFHLVGNVKVDGKNTTVTGDDVTIDFENKAYIAHNAKSTLPPSLMGGGIKGNVYTFGTESYGSAKQSWTNNGDLTTCELPSPHYDIQSDNSDIRPGKRAVFRRARIRLFGRTVLKLPYLAIPLDDRRYNYLPDFGQSNDEGYYVKNKYSMPLNGDDILETREDYMSKLGTGLGLGYGYRNATMAGITRFYRIFGSSKTFTFTNIHNQAFKWGILNLQNDYQGDNYLTTPGSSILNTKASLSINQAPGNSTRFNLTRNSNNSTSYNSVVETLGVVDSRNVGNKTKTDVSVNYQKSDSTYNGGSEVSREQVDLKLKASKELDLATASIAYQRSVPIGDTRNFYSGSDQTPVISLSSDSKRLLGDEFAKSLPFRSELSLGEFQDAQAKEHITRSMFDLNFQRPDRAQDKLFTTNINGRFRQTMYSDDTAQYLLNLDSALGYKFGKDTAANLRYNYLRPYGYSPLQIDQSGQTNYVSGDVSVRPTPPLLMGVQTGYDIVQLRQGNQPWQQVGVRIEYKPYQSFLARSLLTYDTTQRAWSNLRLDVTYTKDQSRVAFAARFDGVNHTWSNVNLYLDGLQFGKTKVSASFQYNGYLKQFDSKQYSFIYDLHCSEALLTIIENNTGFRTGRQLYFSIRLKAFPFSSPFGTGTGGQAIPISTGRDF